jgi:pimeloyl-ACP methyl ester carboxylesterase
MAEQIADGTAHTAHTETLVFTESSDGLPLEGILMRPTAMASSAVAVVWIHGGAAKFCEQHYIGIGRELAARGYPFISGNTRGHDGFTLLWRGDEVIAGGSSFERFDESPRDLSAWIDRAMDLGVRGVVLAGHSLGASKVVYYQARHNDPRVLGLIAASPIVGWQSNPERVSLAEQMVREGRGEDLLPHLEGSPRWNIVSAQMVLTRDQVIRHTFDSDERSPDIAQVDGPLLVLYGTEEMVDPGWLETLRANTRSSVHTDIQLVEGAGHEYAGQERQVAALIAAWITSRIFHHEPTRTADLRPDTAVSKWSGVISPDPHHCLRQIAP